MKIASFLFYYVLPLSLLLCAGFCCPEEDNSENTILIEKDALISIKNNATTFAVGDTIFIESIIENIQLTTDNQNVILSDYFYNDLPESIKLSHSVNLYKDSEFGALVTVPVDIKFIKVLEGNVTTSLNGRFSYISIENTFNQVNFKSEFGIELKEKGTFYLSSTELNSNGIITMTGGDYNLGYIYIDTKIKNADSDGLYKFIVD